MRHANLKSTLLGIAENVPMILWLILYRGDMPLRVCFFAGASAALGAIALSVACRQPQNPLLVACNGFMIFAAAAALFKLEGLVALLLQLRESSWFIAILPVGAVETVRKPAGLLGRGVDSASGARTHGLILLAMAAVGLAISIRFKGAELYSVVLPMTGLFVLQRLLIAKLHDRAGSGGAITSAVAAGNLTGPVPDQSA